VARKCREWRKIVLEAKVHSGLLCLRRGGEQKQEDDEEGGGEQEVYYVYGSRID
jgi:hypothetical protein